MRNQPFDLTVFSTPKPFHGQIGRIQINAIRSWIQLGEACEVLLLGDADGTGRIASALRVRHVLDVPHNEFGTPYLNGLFERAEEAARSSTLCYVNGDIVLLPDLLSTLRHVRAWLPNFLLVGRRTEVFVDGLIDFEREQSEAGFRTLVSKLGSLPAPPGNSDYFVYRAGTLGDLLPLAVGRAWWERWLIYQAHRVGLPVIDATHDVLAVHQDHHRAPGLDDTSSWRKEFQRNLELAGPDAARFTLWDATHRIENGRIRRNFGARYLLRTLDRLPILHPKSKLARGLAAPTQALRRGKSWVGRRRAPSLSEFVVSKTGRENAAGMIGWATSLERAGSPGLNLARSLARAGNPVVLHDPEGSVNLRQLVVGPVVGFAESVQELVDKSRTLVLLGPPPDLKELVDALSCVEAGRSVIDCVGLDILATSPGVSEYCAWEE